MFDRLPNLHNNRWVSVGRLDINTLGVLLLTNDGQLANALMHPSSEIEREYAVRINGKVSDEMITRLKTGVDLEDGPAAFDRFKDEGGEGVNRWFSVTVTEGRNRLVRRMWESQDVMVSRLIRTRYGPISLPKWLPRGKVHELTPKDVEVLSKLAKLPAAPSDNLRVIPVHPRHRRKARNRR